MSVQGLLLGLTGVPPTGSHPPVLNTPHAAELGHNPEPLFTPEGHGLTPVPGEHPRPAGEQPVGWTWAGRSFTRGTPAPFAAPAGTVLALGSRSLTSPALLRTGGELISQHPQVPEVQEEHLDTPECFAGGPVPTGQDTEPQKGHSDTHGTDGPPHKETRTRAGRAETETAGELARREKNRPRPEPHSSKGWQGQGLPF